MAHARPIRSPHPRAAESMGYALALDWRRAIYWFASAVLTAAVTF